LLRYNPLEMSSSQQEASHSLSLSPASTIRQQGLHAADPVPVAESLLSFRGEQVCSDTDRGLKPELEGETACKPSPTNSNRTACMGHTRAKCKLLQLSSRPSLSESPSSFGQDICFPVQASYSAQDFSHLKSLVDIAANQRLHRYPLLPNQRESSSSCAFRFESSTNTTLNNPSLLRPYTLLFAILERINQQSPF
jgi:hypothetical protein